MFCKRARFTFVCIWDTLAGISTDLWGSRSASFAAVSVVSFPWMLVWLAIQLMWICLPVFFKVVTSDRMFVMMLMLSLAGCWNDSKRICVDECRERLV